MILNRLHIENFLERVVEDAVARDFTQESLAVATKSLADRYVHESPHEEEVGIDLPLDLVVALQHASLVVRRHEPLVVARVELLGTCQRQILVDLVECTVRPLCHE